MKFRLLLASAVLATASISAYADTFYVSPEGAGEKTGVDAENAMALADFVSKVNTAGYAGGDTYNFAGGEYIFGENSVVAVPSGKCISLIGDENDQVTFNANGAPCIIHYNGAANEVNVKNINFTGVKTNVDRSSATEKNEIGALMLQNCSKTTVENCSFYGNKAEGTLGGVALNIYGSAKVTLKNCKIYDNDVVARAAVYMHSDSPARGTTIFEDCLFNNNTSTDLGAALFVQHAVQVVVNGCTFVDNNCTGASARGSVIYANGSANINDKNSYADKIYFINSTLAENLNEGGAQIFMADNGHLWMINNVVVSKAEARAEATPAIKFNNVSKATLVSGGYNYVGATTNVPDNSWASTDQTDKDYASIFGTNTLNSNTGLIKPKTFVQGASSTQINAAIEEWGLPTGVTIAERGENVAPGAGAFTQQQVSTGIADIANDADAVKVIALGDGNYTVAGYEGAVEVYSVSGACVLTAVAPELNLSGLASGVYIVRAGKTVAKVVR